MDASSETYKESKLSMSAWEYEAPTTSFESDVLYDPFLLFAGRFRQNGDVGLLLLCQSWRIVPA